MFLKDIIISMYIHDKTNDKKIFFSAFVPELNVVKKNDSFNSKSSHVFQDVQKWVFWNTHLIKR